MPVVMLNPGVVVSSWWHRMAGGVRSCLVRFPANGGMQVTREVLDETETNTILFAMIQQRLMRYGIDHTKQIGDFLFELAHELHQANPDNANVELTEVENPF